MLFDRVASLLLANSNLWRFSQQTSSSQTAISSPSPGNDFSWDDVPAHKSLVYHDCFDGYHCAKLQVPLDWTDEDGQDNRTVEIAVVRLAATVPVTDSRYGGAIILNPGGPGGSGVGMLLREGKYTQTIVSAGPDTAENDTAKFFDIISFDPRGVNNTRPTFTCFPNYVSRLTFYLESASAGIFGSNDMAFTNYWTRFRTMAEECSQRAVESGIGEYMTTASVSRDIIELAERHGEWRENEARKLLQERLTNAKQRIVQQVPESVKYTPGGEKVQYWGFSYGTILGATLAAMYPERMHRVILDGVADSFDYYSGDWGRNLMDADIQITRFGEYCWLGGPKNCALYHEDGPAVIVQRFADIGQKLFKEPIGVPSTVNHSVDLATYSDFKEWFRFKAYAPLAKYHEVAEVLAQLEKGNGTALVQNRRRMKDAVKKGLSEKCEEKGPYSLDCDPDRAGFDQTVAAGIMCTDAVDRTNTTKEEYWEYVKRMMDQSKLIGDTWSAIRLPCTAWHVRPKWRYEGNFTANTLHPILWIGNTADNATPLRNAIKMAKGYPDSVVLQQDSEGHCSSSGVSFCTAKSIRRYFQTGVLPKKGTVCRPDRLPLDGFSEEENPKLPDGETDEEMWRAMVSLARDLGGH